MRAQAPITRRSGGAVGFGDEIEIALQLKRDAPLEISREQRGPLRARSRRQFRVRGQRSLRAFLDQVLDIVLEDERFGLAGPP